MKLKSSQKKFLRYTVGWVLYPFVLILAPLYKWYRKVRYKKQTEIKYKDIINGFSYLVVKDTEVEELAKKRAEACSSCKYAKYSKTTNTIIVGETIHEIKGMHCHLCGCSLAGKLRDEKQTCPIFKW
jgi:hypothetical protein